MIDEKKKVRKEVKRVAMRREVVFRLLKDKCDLKLKKKAIQDQYKQDVESFNRKHKDFMNKMEK